VGSSTEAGEEILAQPAAHEDDEPEAARPRHRARWIVVIGSLVIFGSLAALLMTALALQDDLSRGRASMESGRQALAAGETAEAAASFRQARAWFESARGLAGNPLLRAVGWAPILGRTADAVRAISGSAVMTADAAIAIADTTSQIPGGLAGLVPGGGVVPIDRIRPIAAAAAEADALVERALADVASAPDSLLLGPVAEARRDAEEELGELHDTVHAASLVLNGLPGFLGEDGARTYFFGAQNPAELRGTGGLIGAYSLLTIDAGSFHFSPFVPIHGLDSTPLDALEPPNEDYARNYNHFRRHDRFWTAINVMPDFPSVAKAILTSYRAATGDGLDGVIVADPFALEALLSTTGPVALPGSDIEIGADNVVSFTTNEAYSIYDDSPTRKRILGDVAKAAFERFIAQPSADLDDLRRLLGTAAERHIQIYSEDPLMQEGLRATPVGGALVPPGSDGDLVSVVVNSSAGSKVDFYQERRIRYSVTLRPDGTAASILDLTLRNDAPSKGLARYVIGPYEPGEDDGTVGPILETLVAGESVALVNVYCGSDCVPGETVRNNREIGLGTREDLGVRYVQDYFSILSRERASLSVSWEDPQAWEGNSSGGTYRLTIADQVTIRPTEYRVRIEPPDGMSFASVTAPFRLLDGAAVFEGLPGSRLDAELEFSPSLPTRWWRNVTRFLTTPVFRL
jgi:hypothetical protein